MSTRRIMGFALAAFAAVGMAFTSAGETSADDTTLPASATVLTSKSGTITSTSGSFNSGPAAAFANDGSSRMLKQSKAFNIMYTFATPTVVNGYGIKAGGSYFEAARGPKTWKIYGSNDYDPETKNNDTATWTELDSRGQGDRCAETGWASGNYRFYAFDNSSPYSTYKIDITANNGNDYTQWQYMEYTYTQTDARALTIESSTREVGTVEPGYGLSSQLIGDAVTCSAFGGTWTGANEDETATCNGYVVYKDDGTGQWTEWWRGTDTSFVIESFPAANVKVVWDIAYSAKVGLSDFAHGTVVGDGWYEYGASVELTATPDDGYEFYCWKDIETGKSVKGNPLQFALEKPVSLQPRFVLAGTATVRFVATTGSDDNDGLTVDTPFATIVHAIDDLDEGTIYVAPGTYSEVIPADRVSVCVLSKPIGIVGTGDLPSDVTISRKSGEGRVIQLDNANSFVRNVTISGGYSNSNKGAVMGGNLEITKNGGTVEDCISDGGTVKTYNSAGGGVHVAGGRMARCVIKNGNTSTGYGAQGGGGVYATDSGIVENCLIIGNTVGNYADNCKTAAAGIRATGSARIINCTVLKNGSDKSAYGGCYADGKSQVINCAFFDNKAQAGVAEGNASFGGTADCYVNCASEAVLNDSCLAVELAAAGFAEYDRDDYSLSVASPLRDRGSDYAASGATSLTDIAGTARIFNEIVDIGCYEYESHGIGGDFVVVGDSFGFMPFKATFKATVEGAVGEVTYVWDFDGDGAADLTTTEDTVEWTYDNFDTAGKYNVSVSMSDGSSTLDVTHEEMITAVPEKMYVVPENEGAKYPFATLETAATNLNEAVNAALDGTTILVADGAYLQGGPIEVKRAIVVRGVSDDPAKVTVKNTKGYSGDTCNNNLTMNNADAIVSGITFTDAKIRNRGNSGALIVHSGTVSNCVFSKAEGQVSYYSQCAGLYMDGGLVTHCVIRDNTVDKKSTQGNDTPGASVDGGSLENSLIINNVRNGDTVGTCRALAVGAKGRVVNCDVLNNTMGSPVAEGTGARAVSVAANGILQNCVVFGNKAAKGEETMAIVAAEGAILTASVSEADGLDETAFKNYANGNYTPRSGGLLHEKGVTPEGWKGSELTDLAGKLRVQGETVDIGCYEGKAGGLIVNIH